MIGRIDEAGRALLSLSVLRQDESLELLVDWIDTAFDGELVISRDRIQALGLKQSAAIEATLADGSQVVLESFECSLDWFGHIRRIEVIANDGRYPLLGIGLLTDRTLLIDYPAGRLELS